MDASATPSDPGFELGQLQLALDMSQIGIWRLDLATQRVHANPAALRLLGLPARPGGIEQAELMTLLHPDDWPELDQAARHAWTSGQTVDRISRVQHADGSWRRLLSRRLPVCDGQGQLQGFIGTLLDVSDRLRDEQRLRDADQRVSLVARAAGLGTWEWDLPDGPAHWDAQMFHLRGLAPAAQAPSMQEAIALLHPDDRDRISQFLLRSTAEEDSTQYEFRVVLPDGGVRWLASRSLAVQDESGRTVRRVGINWDISDQRQADQQRQAAALAERESQAKSELLARMSHELRTPLNAILSFTELLLEGEDTLDAASRRQRLRHIQSAGRHLLALVDDVLELSRPADESPAPLQAVLVAPLLGEVMPLVEGIAVAAEVRLEAPRVTPAALCALADTLWLRQVLLNLLSNAIKYNRPGGWVRVEAAATSGGRLLLRVSDNGSGMSQQALHRVFEPFQRAAPDQPPSSGAGIGLAVARSLVQRMGGEIGARSVLGEGSEFEVWLRQAGAPAETLPAGPPVPPVPPVAPVPAVPAESLVSPAPPEQAAATTAADAAPAPQPLLLYIEDNDVNVMIVQELVQRRPGLGFASAADGVSGLRLAAELRPALVLLDMQLPDMPGTEVMRRLRADPRSAAIPCIALSANALPDDIHSALSAGFLEYWTKPLDFAVFNQAMDVLLTPPGSERSPP